MRVRIIKQTDKEKLAMYMKQPKKKLAEMLLNCNKYSNTIIKTNPQLANCICINPIRNSNPYICGGCGGSLQFSSGN